MQFQLSDVLNAIGPNASIIFAAWIFVSFLQSRYDSAVERYREWVDAYRKGDGSDQRREAMKWQIEISSRRCTLMGRAMSVGVLSAVFFLITLIGGALDVMFPHQPAIDVVSSGGAVVGFALVMVAAGIVIFENAGAGNQLRKELHDIDDIPAGVSATKTRLHA